MLHLICGPSGSGKTESLVCRIREDIVAGRRCFLLVPEQQAYISERDLTAVLPSVAGRYFEIVNFSGLAEDVFRCYGGVTWADAGNGVRSLLMWETLRKLSPLLLQYGKSARADMTLTAKMLTAVEELRNNGIDADRLEKAAELLPPNAPLRKKLLDLSLIDASFTALCGEGMNAGISERLLRMAQMLDEHPYFADCSIYIDSFTDFTMPEYQVLQRLLRQAHTVTVALCTDSPYSKMPHFEHISKTAQRLLRLAEGCGGADTELLTPTPGWQKKPQMLQLLERELWDFRLTKKDRVLPPPDEPTAIRTLVCNNLYEEAEACAIRILGLVQDGMHYGDIAVVVRDIEVYRGVIDAALERYGIPCFLSERTELASKPLSRLILSALRAVAHGYRSQDVMTLLKTGLCGVELRDAALFEEYCETWHITGSRFCDSVWSMNPDGLTDRRSARAEEILAAANRVRAAVIEPLQALQTEMRACTLLSDRCRAVYNYLLRLHISEQLSERARRELSLGQKREAGESVRLYRFVTETLAGLCELLPQSEGTVEEFLSALTLFFSSTDLGSVPNVQDCVVIGSAATLRVENLRASFLLGLCEGEFPKADSEDGILTETDKEALEELGINFDSRRNTRSSAELFYVYRAMTKPREQLLLSYPAMQTDGAARTPSLAFTRIGFLFDTVPDHFDTAALQPSEADTAADGDVPLCAPPQPAGSKLRLSQSSIQAFVLCPYRYYATYLLKLRDKKDSSVSAADEGSFLHFVFEQLLRSSLDENGRLHLPAPEELPAAADAIIEAYLQRVCPISPAEMDSRLLHLFERLRGLSLLMLQDIVSEVRASLFCPSRFELPLGGSGSNALPSVRLPLQNGSVVELSGLVDRVDLYDADGVTYVRIVDYKTGRHEFSIEDVCSGVDIQLVLYLFAVLSADPEHLSPAGAQYLFSHSDGGRTKISRSGFLLDEDAIVRAADSTEAAVYSKELLRRSREEIADLTHKMQEVVCDVAERILSGDANKTPSEKACRFCPVKEHCSRAEREKA